MNPIDMASQAATTATHTKPYQAMRQRNGQLL